MASSSGIAALISLVRLTSSFPLSSMGKVPTLFLGVANLALLTDHAHHMRALALLIQGVALGLAVDGRGDSHPLAPTAFVPALQGAIQIGGRDAN